MGEIRIVAKPLPSSKWLTARAVAQMWSVNKLCREVERRLIGSSKLVPRCWRCQL